MIPAHFLEAARVACHALDPRCFLRDLAPGWDATALGTAVSVAQAGQPGWDSSMVARLVAKTGLAPAVATMAIEALEDGVEVQLLGLEAVERASRGLAPAATRLSLDRVASLEAIHGRHGLLSEPLSALLFPADDRAARERAASTVFFRLLAPPALFTRAWAGKLLPGVDPALVERAARRAVDPASFASILAEGHRGGITIDGTLAAAAYQAARDALWIVTSIECCFLGALVSFSRGEEAGAIDFLDEVDRLESAIDTARPLATLGRALLVASDTSPVEVDLADRV